MNQKKWTPKYKPFRNLEGRLSLAERLKEKADKELAKSSAQIITSWIPFHYELVLVSVVSSFEFFFRELVLNKHILNSKRKSKYYSKFSGRFNKKMVNFQNYDRIRNFLQNEFKIDIEMKMEPLEIEWLKFIIAIRHLLVHNGGFVDKKFMKLIKSFSHLKDEGYSMGKHVGTGSIDINVGIKIILKMMKIVEEEVKKLP
ncbi:MAG: hypothetical protein ACE5K0_12405 [Candidatus Methanofastidiosia archaeon]